MTQKTVGELRRELMMLKRGKERGYVKITADNTGVDQSQVSRILSGNFVRITPNVKKICKYANISLNKHSAITSKNVFSALDEVWDGSEEVERLLVNAIKGLKPVISLIRNQHV
ncbi:MAG: hypothetical protein JXR18_14070 [Neptuniibacter sp.]